MKDSETDDKGLDVRPLLALVAAGIVILIFAFMLGRCTSPQPHEEPLIAGIDAGPGEELLAAELDGAVVAEDERLAALEREHAAELVTFNELERQKYDEARSAGRAQLATWLKDRSRLLLGDSGT